MHAQGTAHQSLDSIRLAPSCNKNSSVDLPNGRNTLPISAVNYPGYLAVT